MPQNAPPPHDLNANQSGIAWLKSQNGPWVNVQNQSGTLKFQNEDHVLQVYNALCSLYEARADYLRDLALGMDSIELAGILEDYEAASSMFNGNLPLEEFETALSFQSLRAQLAADDEAFLDQEEIDLDNLPSGQIPIQIPAMLALLDPQGKIIVGEQVVNVLQDVQDDIDEQFKSSNCAWGTINQDTMQFSNTFRVRQDAGVIRPGIFNHSEAYSRVRLYYKDGIRWRPAKRVLGSDWHGPILRRSDCTQMVNKNPGMVVSGNQWSFSSDYTHRTRCTWVSYSASRQVSNKTLFTAYWANGVNWNTGYNGPYTLQYH